VLVLVVVIVVLDIVVVLTTVLVTLIGADPRTHEHALEIFLRLTCEKQSGEGLFSAALFRGYMSVVSDMVAVLTTSISVLTAVVISSSVLHGAPVSVITPPCISLTTTHEDSVTVATV
jgi:hypothetical protein